MKKNTRRLIAALWFGFSCQHSLTPERDRNKTEGSTLPQSGVGINLVQTLICSDSRQVLPTAWN